MGVSVARGVSLLPVERSLNMLIDGGGSPIVPGSVGFVRTDFYGKIIGWTVAADQVGSIVVDVRACPYDSFPATASIAGTELPTLAAAQKNQNLDLTTWLSLLRPDTVLEFVVLSAATVQKATVDLRIQ